MGDILRFEVKTKLKGDVALLQESVRDFAKSLPNQLFGNPLEVDLGAGQNVVPHRFNFTPNGYLLIYQGETDNEKGVSGTTINNAGSFSVDGIYPAQQLSTSGSGTGAAFSVTIIGGVVTKVLTTSNGVGYNVNETITLTGIPSQLVACVLNVSDIDNGYSKIYHYKKPDTKNFYLNSSAATNIKIVVV